MRISRASVQCVGSSVLIYVHGDHPLRTVRDGEAGAVAQTFFSHSSYALCVWVSPSPSLFCNCREIIEQDPKPWCWVLPLLVSSCRFKVGDYFGRTHAYVLSVCLSCLSVSL